MDLKEMVDGADGPWTEERHSSFLNWVEECFVRRILHAGNDSHLAVSCSAAGWRHHHHHQNMEDYHLPLDRYLPDSATESTRDVRSAGRNMKRPPPPSSVPTAPLPAEPGKEESAAITGRDRTRKRRPLLPPRYDALREQVDDVEPQSNKRMEATGVSLPTQAASAGCEK